MMEMTIGVIAGLAIVAFAFATILWWRARYTPGVLIGLGLTALTLALVLVLSTVTPPAPIPPPTTFDAGGYRPHFQGFGSDTTGGRGGIVCRVTTYGDLVGCVAPRQGCADTPSTCARTVIFDVSGTLDGQNGQLNITSPYLTLAGQTAPRANEGSCSANCESEAGGITLARTRLLVDTHDVVIQHVRIRRPPPQLNGCSVGDAGDGGSNAHVFRVIFDHVTCTWAQEVNNYLAAGPGSHAIMLVDSLIGEGLWPGALGGIGAGVAQDSTIVRNLFTQHYSRQPIWGSPTHVILANNVSYNGTDNTPAGDTLPAFYGDADGDATSGSEETVILNNVMIPGPSSGSVRAFLGLSKQPASVPVSRLYLSGNVGPGLGGEGDGQWQSTVCGNYGSRYQNAATCGPTSNVRTNAPFPWFTELGFVALPASAVKTQVLANAGARPLDRDAADWRMVEDVQQGTGTHFLDWAAVEARGGMPVLAQRSRVCALPSEPNAPGSRLLTDGNANTQLEDYLETDPACGAQRLEVPPPVTRRGMR